MPFPICKFANGHADVAVAFNKSSTIRYSNGLLTAFAFRWCFVVDLMEICWIWFIYFAFCFCSIDLWCFVTFCDILWHLIVNRRRLALIIVGYSIALLHHSGRRPHWRPLEGVDLEWRFICKIPSKVPTWRHRIDHQQLSWILSTFAGNFDSKQFHIDYVTRWMNRTVCRMHCRCRRETWKSWFSN